jgi:hypothetical protein
VTTAVVVMTVMIVTASLVTIIVAAQAARVVQVAVQVAQVANAAPAANRRHPARNQYRRTVIRGVSLVSARRQFFAEFRRALFDQQR